MSAALQAFTLAVVSPKQGIAVEIVGVARRRESNIEIEAIGTSCTNGIRPTAGLHPPVALNS